MHIFSITLFILSVSIAVATDTSLAIDLIGLTPKGDLLAWHEKGITGAGEFERYVIAKTLDLSPTDVFTISDPLTAAVVAHKPDAVKAARQKIKSLGIKSGRGTQEINDIYGNYRQLAFTARLYLKASPSRREYNLEVYDEMSGRTRITGSDKIPTDDTNIMGMFRIKQARLSRDRSVCAVVVEQTYELDGRHTVDKLYTFMVFAAPPPEMPPPGGPPPGGPPPH
jgi:hypothetical protein